MKQDFSNLTWWRRRMLRVKTTAVVAMALAFSGHATVANAQSYFWTNAFTITQLYVSGSANFHFRVYGMATISNCPNATTWAYINEADDGEKGKMATLLTAYAMGKQVQLIVAPVNGYCQILEVNVTG